MKLNVKRKDCKFIIKPEDRVVICVIPTTEEFDIKNLVIDFIGDNNNGYIDFDVWGNMYRKMQMPSSFTGKAVCAPEDEWDEELGKKIAYSRAKNKLYTSFFKRANTFVQDVDKRLNDFINTFNNLGTVLDINRGKLEDQIDKALGKELPEE